MSKTTEKEGVLIGQPDGLPGSGNSTMGMLRRGVGIFGRQLPRHPLGRPRRTQARQLPVVSASQSICSSKGQAARILSRKPPYLTVFTISFS